MLRKTLESRVQSPEQVLYYALFYRSWSGARLQDVQRKTTTIHARTGFKFLFVCKLKTETHASVEGKNWCKVQPMGVNKLNKIMKDMTQAAGIPGKTNDSGRKPLVQKLQESGVPPNQIIQITGHKNLQSVNNYSSLREQQMESISRILSSTTKAATNVAQTENNLTAQPLAEYRISSTSTASSTLDVNSFHENRLQTIFHGNYITGGVFNINFISSRKKWSKESRSWPEA